MIQILGLRDYFNKKQQKTMKAERFFEKKWRAPSVIALLANPDKYLEDVPEAERYNLYFTVASCKEEGTAGAKGRELEFQNILPIDIDHIDVEKQEETARAACEAIGLNYDFTGIIFSGNGLQMFVFLDETIERVSYFDEERIFYKAMCKRIEAGLRSKGLAGDLDSSVFSSARLMRMPNTLNKKPNKPERMAKVMQSHIESQNFSLRKASGIPEVRPEDQIAKEVLKEHNTDTETVLESCAFLNHCNQNQEEVDEPSWYAMLGVLGYLKNGTDLAHEYSKYSKSYTPEGTNEKLAQAKAASGPRTCDSINSLWGGCADCKHFGKQKSPVLIKGADYIKTKDTGFRTILYKQDGTPKDSKPICFDDLLKYYNKKEKIRVLEGNKEFIAYENGIWKSLDNLVVRAFVDKHVTSPVRKNDRNEFEDIVKSKNLVRDINLQEMRKGKINMLNCVYDTEADEILEQSPDYFFFNKTSFDYDKKADCPKFKKFLDEIMMGDEAKIRIIQEYCGYGMIGQDLRYQKALLLIGEGSNGKSVLLEILEGMFAEGSTSSASLEEIAEEPNIRYECYNKVMNICEESDGDFTKSIASVFKNIVTGGKVTVHKYFHGKFQVRWEPTLIASMNNRPVVSDRSGATRRRLIFLTFDYVVPKEKVVLNLAESILKEEAAGIFNYFLEGYRRLQARKRFDIPKETEDYTDDLIKENDPLAQFIEDEYEITKEEKDQVVIKDTYQIYTQYLTDSGRHKGGFNKQKFVTEVLRRIKRKNPEVIKRKMVGSKKEYYLKGVKTVKEAKF